MAIVLSIMLALAAAGVVSIPAFGKLASAGSSGSSRKSKFGEWLSNAWDKIKGWFKKGTQSPANTITGVGPDGGVEQLSLAPTDEQFVDPTQSSAQTASQGSDVGTSVAYNQQTGDGGSAQQSDDEYEKLRKLFAFLGLSNLLSGEKENYSWMQDYGSIVGDERLYGSEMINDARRWEEYMSGTAYQRTFKDIEAAGYNPWLALQSGGVNPVGYGSVDSGSALGSISTSLSQSISQGNSNSSSAIIVALIAMLAKLFS